MRSLTKGSSATSACFVDDGQPYVIPTLYARLGDEIYFHGSAASRMLRTLDGGVDACLTVTLVDDVVLARSIFNHSINYRSVVVSAAAPPVTVVAEKRRALEAFSGRLLPGRWADVRPPTATELRATSILRIQLDEASAKIRTARCRTTRRTTAGPVWAGVIPLALTAGEPQPDPAARARIRASAGDAQRTRSAEDRPKRPIGAAGQPH
jgi:nitroimidazol reductase NimA-like FMN-containing flavoprotein (pyridoxamine 5'-phosphate oxidase superfamily)